MAAPPHSDREAPDVFSFAKAGALVAAAPLGAFAIAAVFLNPDGLGALTWENISSGGVFAGMVALGVAAVGAVLGAVVGVGTGGRHPVEAVGMASGLGAWVGPLIGAMVSRENWGLHGNPMAMVIGVPGGIAVWILGAILWLRLTKPKPELYTKQAQRRGWRSAVAALSIIFGFVQCNLASRQVGSPSESVADSKRRGVFLQQLQLPSVRAPTDSGPPMIEELWVERVRETRLGVPYSWGFARMVARFAPDSPPTQLFVGMRGDEYSTLSRTYEGRARSRVVSGSVDDRSIPDSLEFLPRAEARRRSDARYRYRPAQPAPDSTQVLTPP